MRVTALTDIGKMRVINQDNFYISEIVDIPLYIVADGMGGHKAGEYASMLGIKYVVEFLELNHLKMNTIASAKNKIREAMEYSNKKVYSKSIENKEFNGMGTTMTLIYVLDTKIIVGHVGDSRAYLISDDEIFQITEDHTYVNKLIKEGKLCEIDKTSLPSKHIITKALGTEIDLFPDVFDYNIGKNNLLICSDGLTNMVNDDEILNLYKKYGKKEDSLFVNKLIELSNNNGGRDNTTVVFLNNEVEV